MNKLVYGWEELAESDEFEHGTLFVLAESYDQLAEENKALKAELVRMQKIHQEAWKAFSNHIGEDHDKFMDGMRSLANKELKAREALLVEALEFYASGIYHRYGCDQDPEVIQDGGDTAREALAQLKRKEV